MTRRTASILTVLFLLAAIAAPSFAGDGLSDPEDDRGIYLWPDPFREDPAAAKREASAAVAMEEDGATPGILHAPWRFEVGVYGWLPRAPADIVIDGTEIADIPESLDTILESLEMVAFVKADVSKGPIRLFGDFMYYKGKWDDDIRGPITGDKQKIEIEEKVWLIKYGVAYDIVQKLGRGDDEFTPTVTWGPYVGFLGFYDKFREKIGPRGNVSSGSVTKKIIRFNTPVVGLSANVAITPKWGCRIEANYGGWDVDNVDKTYELHGTAWL